MQKRNDEEQAREDWREVIAAYKERKAAEEVPFNEQKRNLNNTNDETLLQALERIDTEGLARAQ